MADAHGASRRLRSRCEAIFGAHFRAPEFRRGAFGLTPVQWYMSGRAAPLGAVASPIAIAVFGSFNPRLVRAGIDGVWDLVTPELAADRKLASALVVLERALPGDDSGQLAAAIELLDRGLGAATVAGHPLFAGLSTFPRPSDPRALLWRLCDMMREHRSDAHVAAWRSADLDPVEVNVLNELWRGAPVGSIACADMDWTTDDVDAALARLTTRGLAVGTAITDAGHDLREGIERATSAQQSSIIEALGTDVDTLIDLLDPWARAVAAA